MDSEIKQCQNCKKDFIIEPEDFEFYDKIKVPAPTWCPECRIKRRMNWRNERTLYKRKCDVPCHSEDLISIYSVGSPLKVYDYKYWWSDEFDAIEYGRDYDFSKPFFNQLQDLIKEVPVNNIITTNNVNCDYTNFIGNSKNCYLTIGGLANEDTLYSNHVFNIKDSSDIYFCDKMELSYEDLLCQSSYRLFFSQQCENCTNSYFLYNCKNCSSCFGCVGLRNKQYNIFNKQYSKEEYEREISNLDFGSFNSSTKQKEVFNKFKLKFPNKYANLLRSYDSTGDNITDAKNVKHSYDCLAGGSEDCKYTFWAGVGMKDIYDGTACGVGGGLDYEITTGALATSRTFFSAAIWGGLDIYYSYNCQSSSKNLFGCVGLKRKQYCILNKQYTPDEYMELKARIMKHMDEMPYVDSKGRVYKYGEFFPPELSPFSYNETVAQEYFPLTKQQAIEQGYKWKDPEQRNLQITMNNKDLPDHIKDVPDSIVNEIIQCSHAIPRESASNNSNNLRSSASTCNEQCTEAFKIIQSELDFYRKMNLPLPRLCPNCRHYQRIKQRNPLKLWKRQCQCAGTHSDNGIYQNTISHDHGDDHCENTFETTYSPGRPEIVYCEKCYNAEVV